jgi:hypothetical protein
VHRKNRSFPPPDAERQKEVDASRRKFLKRAAYVPPAIVTLKVAPAYAKNGSAKPAPPRRPVTPPALNR